MKGTYAFVYGGYIGVGIGVFRVAGSDFVGADHAGCKYRGTVSKDLETGEITVSFDMFVPAGMLLVQGTSPLEFDTTKTGSFTAPPDFGEGEPFKVYIEPGYINLMVKRIPDEYSTRADGIGVDMQPVGR